MKISRVALGVVVFLVVAVIAFGGWYLVDQVFLEGQRQAREAEAARALKDLGALVVVEPSTKQASTVNFCEKPLTEVHLKHLENLHRLGVVLFDRCEVPDDFMDTVSRLSSVNSLSLSGLDLSSEEIDQVGQLSNLDSLYLRGVAVKDENLDAIAGLSNLLMLDLSETQITDAGLEKLSALQNLDTLFLCRTAVTDSGVDVLAKIPLKRLVLLDTAVTKEAAAKLKEQLPNASVEVGNRPVEESPSEVEEGAETPADSKQ